jgi:acyl-coenzyme A thioesterase 1/2/4
MPHTPAPETLLPREEMLERLVTEPLLPRDYRNQVATEISVPFPIDIRFCEPNRSTKQNKSPPRLS